MHWKSNSNSSFFPLENSGWVFEFDFFFSKLPYVSVQMFALLGYDGVLFRVKALSSTRNTNHNHGLGSESSSGREAPSTVRILKEFKINK